MKSSSSTRKRAVNQRVSNPRQRKQQHLLDVKVRARKASGSAVASTMTSRWLE